MTMRDDVLATLDEIIDPCSVASGAPGGLVSMGLVRDVRVDGPPDASRVVVELCITEAGCLMASIFELTARREVSGLSGVASVEVTVDHDYVWDPSDMAPEYRERLDRVRKLRRVQHEKRQLSLPLHPAAEPSTR
jgi:metal-sulfur cluster biosynthetic enzyme